MSRQRLAWRPALAIWLALATCAGAGGASAAQPASSAESKASAAADLPARHRAAEEVRALRLHWRDLAYRDFNAAVVQLRAEHELARRRGDRHHEWLCLAWLASYTATFDLPASRPLMTEAERAIDDARRAGDKLATFELMLMTESTGILQFAQAPRPARVDELQTLATDIGGPLHEGLVWKLRGIIASQQGQEGEALYMFQRAQPLLQGEIERAELLVFMALALFDNPSRPASNLAAAYLDEVVRSLPPEKYRGLLAPILRLSQLMSRLERHVEAVELSQRALTVARLTRLPTPLARAYLARGQAYLGAGESRAALADFDAVSLDALNDSNKLGALSGRALALAQLGDATAEQALDAGHRIAQAQEARSKAGLAQYFESTARTWQLLGKPTRALDDLAHAASIRLAVASAVQERLAQARLDAAQEQLQARRDADRRRLLTAGAAALLLALLAFLVLQWRQVRLRQTVVSLTTRLQAAHAELQQLSDARSQQRAAACRELRQPTHVLSLLSEPDLAHMREPEGQRRYFEAVRRCSRSLTEMLDALMDKTRLQEGSYVPHAERFDLAELLSDLERRFCQAAEQKGLQWVLHLPSLGVFSDRHLLRRVVFNLVGHAVRHGRQGRLQVQVVPSDRHVCIEVIASDGQLPGLAAAAQADDDTEALGQGLTAARQACDMLGHELLEQRAPSLGVMFRVRLPRAFLPVEPGPVPAQPAVPTREPAGERVVAIVEDEAFCRVTLVNALVDAGLDAQGYESFEALLAPGSRFSQSPPGVLVTDLNLGDGIGAGEMLRDLRRRVGWRDVPILLLTGDVREEVEALAEELGVALAYKPISARRLRERIALLRVAQPLPLSSVPTDGGRPALNPQGA
jgi:signal transduction histidine kinase